MANESKDNLYKVNNKITRDITTQEYDTEKGEWGQVNSDESMQLHSTPYLYSDIWTIALGGNRKIYLPSDGMMMFQFSYNVLTEVITEGTIKLKNADGETKETWEFGYEHAEFFLVGIIPVPVPALNTIGIAGIHAVNAGYYLEITAGGVSGGKANIVVKIDPTFRTADPDGGLGGIDDDEYNLLDPDGNTARKKIG